MQKAIIVCLSKQKDEIINLLQLNDYSFEPLLSNEQLYLIGDIEEYQINLLINIIKHYKIIRNEIEKYSELLKNKKEVVIATKMDLENGNDNLEKFI